MNKPMIEAMTWFTLIAAVVSACSLAVGDADSADPRLPSMTGLADGVEAPLQLGSLAVPPAGAPWQVPRIAVPWGDETV